MGCFFGCFRFKEKERPGGVQTTVTTAKCREVTDSRRHSQSGCFNVSAQDVGESYSLETMLDCTEPMKTENLCRRNGSIKLKQQFVKSPERSSNGPSPELIPLSMPPTPSASAKLTDLSEEDENKKFNEEVKYLKSCGTILRTPSEIREARQRSPSKDAKNGNSDWHSWFPSSPAGEIHWNCPPENSPKQTSARFVDANHNTEDEEDIKQKTEQTGCKKEKSANEYVSASTPPRSFSVGDDEEHPVGIIPISSKVHSSCLHKPSRYDHCPTIEEDNESISDAGSTASLDSAAKNDKPNHNLKHCDSPDRFEPKTPPLFNSNYSPKPTPLVLTEDMQTPWTTTMGNPGVNRNARMRAQYVHPVLNPVENISQWKELKKGNLKDYEQKSISWSERSNVTENQSVCFQTPASKGMAIDNGIPKIPNSYPISRADSVTKENFPSEEEMKFKQDSVDVTDESLQKRKLVVTSPDIFKTPKLMGVFHQIPEGTQSPAMQVDSSLSHWLKTPPIEHGKNSSSCKSVDDKPILGAMTVTNLQSISSARSPTSKSSGDYDRPILGMVAAHWNDEQCAPPKWWDGKGIPNSTNKYKEDQKVSWHSTPFEERLEKALSTEGVTGRELFAVKPATSEETVESATAAS